MGLVHCLLVDLGIQLYGPTQGFCVMVVCSAVMQPVQVVSDLMTEQAISRPGLEALPPCINAAVLLLLPPLLLLLLLSSIGGRLPTLQASSNSLTTRAACCVTVRCSSCCRCQAQGHSNTADPGQALLLLLLLALL